MLIGIRNITHVVDLEIVGKNLYQSVSPELSKCLYRGFQGTRLLAQGTHDEGWSPLEVARKGGVFTVPKEGFFMIPDWQEHAKRIAATWARHQEDSVLVEVASNTCPKKSAIGGGLHFFSEGTVVYIVRIDELSEVWKGRANRS